MLERDPHLGRLSLLANRLVRLHQVVLGAGGLDLEDHTLLAHVLDGERGDWLALIGVHLEGDSADRVESDELPPHLLHFCNLLNQAPLPSTPSICSSESKSLAPSYLRSSWL